MSSIKLSICIPTYNREKYLGETIDSVINQITNDISDKVEIVVSDNASTDNTEKLIKTYQSKFENFVYYRWPQNMGADKNYLKVIDIAHGEYCWFLGSDDKLFDGSVERILDEIQSETIDIIVFEKAESDAALTTTPFVDSWTKLTGNYSFHSKNDKEKFYNYLNKCVAIGGIFSFLSVIVFKKDKWDSVAAKEIFIGSAFVHVYVLLTMLKEGAFFNYIKEPLVLRRMDNDSFCPEPHNHLNIYNRWKIDIDGFRDIPLYVFGSDSYEYYCIHKLIKKYIKAETYVSIKLSCDKKYEGIYDNRVKLLFLNNGFYLKYVWFLILQNFLIWKVWKTLSRLKMLLKRKNAAYQNRSVSL